MEAVRRWRQRRYGKVAMLSLCIVTMFLSAYFISLGKNEAEQKKVSAFWKSVGEDFVTIFTLQAVESQSPVLEYGLYSKAGMKTFPDWQLAMLTGGISVNGNLKSLLACAEAEQENIQVASNGKLDDVLIIDRAVKENENTGEVGSILGDSYFENESTADTIEEDQEALAHNKYLIKTLKKNLNREYLIQNFYIVHPSTTIDNSVFNVEKLVKKDCTMKKDNSKPQILIYHTHGGSEHFVDSRDGEIEDSVVGVGKVLANILEEKYGYNVIHDKTRYDVINGAINRNKAYNAGLEGVKKQLAKNPSIEVLIDLHRDSASQNKKRVTTIDGKPTAQIMFFNGLSRDKKGDIAYLKNPNLQGNLAFSLQMKMKTMELYPDFANRIYLKHLRYNLHLREKSLLIELGTNLNTVEESKNAMEPLARVLNEVLNE